MIRFIFHFSLPCAQLKKFGFQLADLPAEGQETFDVTALLLHERLTFAFELFDEVVLGFVGDLQIQDFLFQGFDVNCVSGACRFGESFGWSVFRRLRNVAERFRIIPNISEGLGDFGRARGFGLLFLDRQFNALWGDEVFAFVRIEVAIQARDSIFIGPTPVDDVSLGSRHFAHGEGSR